MISFVIFALFYSLSSVAAQTTVSVPLRSLPQSLQVDRLVQVDQNRVSNLMVDSLFKLGTNFRLTPNIAESVTWSKDGKTATIALKKVKFSDGTVVKANDIVTTLSQCIKMIETGINVSLQNIVGFKQFRQGRVKALSGIKSASEKTIEIQLVEKTPLLIDDLSHTACSIVKNSKGGSNDLFNGAVGTGPYILSSRDSQKLVLKKNKFFHGKNDGPDQVIFRSTQDYGDLESLKSWSDLILVDSETPPQDGFNRFPHSELGSYHLVFNNSKPPFDSEQRRKAVALALDFEALSSGMSWDSSRLQKGLFSYGMRGFLLRSDLKPKTKEANEILRSLGYSKENPFSFTIYLAKSDHSDAEANAWPKLFPNAHILVKAEVISQKKLMERRDVGNFEALKIGKAPGSVDPYLILASLFKGSRYNTPKANQPHCDGLTHKALRESDSDSRFQLYKEAESCFLAHHVLVPLTSLNPGYVFLRQPWQLTRTNQYLLYPYSVNEWTKSETR